MRLEDVEREAIMAAYTFYRGNKTQTAAALNIAIRTLDNKLAKYKGDAPEPERGDSNA